jgi:hypothetical protein
MAHSKQKSRKGSKKEDGVCAVLCMQKAQLQEV